LLDLKAQYKEEVGSDWQPVGGGGGKKPEKGKEKKDAKPKDKVEE